MQDVQPNRERTVIGEVEIDLKQLSFEQQRWMVENPGKSLYLLRYANLITLYDEYRFASEDAIG